MECVALWVEDQRIYYLFIYHLLFCVTRSFRWYFMQCV